MPLKQRQEMDQETELLAKSYSCVAYNYVPYMPADCDTLDWSVTPPPDRRVWLPLNTERLQRIVKELYDTKFLSAKELGNYQFMVYQEAQYIEGGIDELLIRTDEGLRVLKEDGQLHVPDGSFIPNVLPVKLNTDPDVKQQVMDTLTEWLSDEEEAISLLRHCATALAPGWSATKYVILIGEGRNGKSLFLEMLESVLGTDNVSNISRQLMEKADTTCTALLNKLANIVYDGMAQYVKDSANEKSFVAGETVSVRRLYVAEPVQVHTNALFLEALNEEPSSRDKSTALQARISRFWFPNKYANDSDFKAKMLSEEYLGAFLSLLIDHYVKRSEEAVMLAPTARAEHLRLEHVINNAPAMQFLDYQLHQPGFNPDLLIGSDLADTVADFRSWRTAQEGDLWADKDIRRALRTILLFKEARKRPPGGGAPTRYYKIEGWTSDALALMEKEDSDVPGLVDD